MQKLYEYFPDLTKKQYEQIETLCDLYTYWNEKINVIRVKTLKIFLNITFFIPWLSPNFLNSNKEVKFLMSVLAVDFQVFRWQFSFPKYNLHSSTELQKKLPLQTILLMN